MFGNKNSLSSVTEKEQIGNWNANMESEMWPVFSQKELRLESL